MCCFEVPASFSNEKKSSPVPLGGRYTRSENRIASTLYKTYEVTDTGVLSGLFLEQDVV
jgi:hypothetical protein